jgi:sodium/pantothenate symporter
MRPPEFLQYVVVFSGTGLAATFLCPTLFAIYWPRMNKVGCLAGMLGGFGSFVAQYLSFGTKSFGGFDPFVWALLTSLVCSVAGARLSRPPTRELTLRYFGDGAV